MMGRRIVGKQRELLAKDRARHYLDGETIAALIDALAAKVRSAQDAVTGRAGAAS